MTDRTGQHIGNYRLLRLLGEGTFAQVYLGEHRYLKSAAALKILHHTLTEQKEQHFLEEAQTLVRLRHAHIVRVLDFAVEDGMPVLVMDYIPGGTLRHRHPRGTRLPIETTLEYVKQIASALQYAHNHYIIHRDVKPDNVLVDSDDRLVLSDFGLALFAPAPDQLSNQALAGTLPYISPEQARGKPCFASDQYALGVLTYEWLTGVRPFEGRYWEVIEKHLIAPPPPLRAHRPELSATIEQVVLRALAKDPQERYVSMHAFAQALEYACHEDEQIEDDSQITASWPAIRNPSTVMPAGAYTLRTIFLSAAPNDELVAARLAADLKRRGLMLSNDFPGAVSAQDQEESLRQAMRATHHLVVVVTPHTRSSRVVREHLRVARMYQRQPVLVWMEGDEMGAMLLDRTWDQLLPVDVIDARGTRYQTALEELLVCLREDTYVSSNEQRTHSTALGEEPRNPYKGLRAFQQRDALDFFGRDALLAEMIKRLKSMLAERTQCMLTVVGASGSGKSSVVLAGLLPRLQAGALPESQEWIYLEPIVPGTRPVEALALALAPRFPERSLKMLWEDLHHDSARGLHWLATQLVKGADCRLVLVIDQFEELFSQTIAEEERRCFVDLLVTAVTEVRGPVLVILTLRADFSDRPMRYPTLARLVEAHRQPVLPMEIHELREVIEGPASLPDVQLTFEGNLAGDLLYESQGQVGALPLLQFTLDQLFQQREGQVLTLAAYQSIGGVKGALVKQAEATYATLPSDEHRRLARALFLRLIDPGMSEQDTTRRRASLAELSLPDAHQTAIIQQVAHAFITARLLTTNEMEGTTTIEVSHEALIREWPRLVGWLREAREDIHIQQAVSQDATGWERRGKPKDRLYRGTQLREAQRWASRNMTSAHEAQFLQTSTARQTRIRTIAIVLSLLVVLCFGVVFHLIQEGVFIPTIVTTTSGTGPGSLEQVINSAPPGSTINFDSSLNGKTISLGGKITIGKNLILRGLGVKSLAISSSNSGHYIEISSGFTVKISGLTFTNSHIKESNKSILTNEGNLTVSDCLITNNTTDYYGGGIYNQGKLTLLNSTVSGNTATHSGGGLYNTEHGIMTVDHSTVSGNTAVRSGGGIYNTYDSVLILTNTTVSNNTARGAGGGISNDSSPLTGINSTISDNAAFTRGGGLSNFGGQVDLQFSTIFKNKANDSAGGILSEDSTDDYGHLLQKGKVSVGKSIVAGNSSKVGPNISGTLTSNGYNLFQDLSGANVTQNKDVLVPINADLLIDPVLRDNGGITTPHTFTYALLRGSPAINAILLADCHSGGISTDQRGVKRPDKGNDGCDIGAYEYEG